MSIYLNALRNSANYTRTENGGLAHKSTQSYLLDMFGMGAAMRSRPDNDVILMFRNAFEENPVYALKCLFYIRDIRGGQGERRFFRLCIRDLAKTDPDAMRRNIKNIPEYGRWDDLYELINTPVEGDMWKFMKHQLALDVESKTPSLLAKWMKSENTSSKTSRRLGRHTRVQLHMTPRQYRQTLSILRERINVLERLMSAQEWDKIEFDKIPSKAGFIYKNAFARHDVERMMEAKGLQSYKDFIKDETKTVNAKDLYPYEIVGEAVQYCDNRRRWNWRRSSYEVIDDEDSTKREVINKYWKNYMETIDEFTFNGIAVVDTSGSMVRSDKAAPINVAISLGICCAEKARGPFHGHYISFSSCPQLIEVKGTDFVDMVDRIVKTNLCQNTNIEGVFDLLLDTARANHCKQEDIPENIVVISDMEFDTATGGYYYKRFTKANAETELERIAENWRAHGYEMPKLIFWNVDARQNNIPALGDTISYVSGMSPSIYSTIASGKTGYDLMMEKLNSPRYKAVA